MTTNLHELRTVDGHSFRVLGTGLPGPYPTVIFVDGHGAFSLDANNVCAANNGMSLIPNPRELTRYFNVYRANDGGFVFGSKAFASEQERLSTTDSARAVAGVRVDFNDITGGFTIANTRG